MSIADEMSSAAGTLLTNLDDGQRKLAALPFADEQARRWLEYRPRRRPGLSIAELTPAARKTVHRLLSTALSEHAYAQAMGIVALEEVLDRKEDWQRHRHSGDYWISVFGDPRAGGQTWAWRFEGHHLSVSMTVAGDVVSPAPVFFGANPARVSYAGRTVSRPLAPEEDVARELLDELGPEGRSAAVVSRSAPPDIRTGTNPRAAVPIEPAGIAASAVGSGARRLLGELVTLYLDRLPAELAAREQTRLATSELHFAWEGPVTPGTRHYYRVQGDDLLIEYDNTTEDGNHAHTVLRRPRSDFGEDVLGGHLRLEHDPAGRAALG